MDIQIDDLVFAIPEGCEDWTDYSFVSPDEDEMPSAVLYDAEPTVYTVAELAADQRPKLLDFFEGEAKIVHEEEFDRHGEAAIVSVLAYGEDKHRLETSLLSVRRSSRRLAWLNYCRGPARKETEGVWNLVPAAVLEPSDDEEAQPASPIAAETQCSAMSSTSLVQDLCVAQMGRREVYDAH